MDRGRYRLPPADRPTGRSSRDQRRSPQYLRVVELERLLPLLGADVRPFYRAVVGMYVHPRFVRRAVCAKCHAVRAPALVGELHSHPHRKSGAFVPRMVRVPLYPVEQGDVDGAIVWFDEHWRGEVYVPDELLPLVAVA